MKLSQTVQIYNQLCNYDINALKNDINTDTSAIVDFCSDITLQNAQQQLLRHVDQFAQTLDQSKMRIKAIIDQQEKTYLLQSYKIYEQNIKHKYEWFDMDDTNQNKTENVKLHLDKILARKLDITIAGEAFVTGRIMQHAGWKNTTMILHPAQKSWLTNMVSNDPLYLVDEYYDLLKLAIAEFNTTYRNRLRTVVVKENTSAPILKALPDNQFGLVVAWNYFNHRPFEVIRNYLLELYAKLRPGGNLLMTFNDCNRWKGVLACENQSALYTPGTLITTFAERLGFEIVFQWHEDGPWTWIELRKPGEWHSLRGGQALAKIIPKPVAKSK